MTRSALIVAHGQPSDPAPAEDDLARLSASVANLLPSWRVGSATLAQPGAVETALCQLDRPLVFPFFMADGWFTRTELPRRLDAAGGQGLAILPAFGLMGEVTALAGKAARTAVLGRSWRIEDTCLILAAHGSGRSREPAAAARAIEAAIMAALPFREVRTGFIEETPSLAKAAEAAGERAICLPLFVARWGHVLADIPQALAQAGFRGPCLAPIGARPEVAGIVANALSHAA